MKSYAQPSKCAVVTITGKTTQSGAESQARTGQVYLTEKGKYWCHYLKHYETSSQECVQGLAKKWKAGWGYK